jgi:hypothetical protein
MQVKLWVGTNPEPDWRPFGAPLVNSVGHYLVDLYAPFPPIPTQLQQRGTFGLGWTENVLGTYQYNFRYIIGQNFDFDTNVDAVGFGPGDP